MQTKSGVIEAIRSNYCYVGKATGDPWLLELLSTFASSSNAALVVACLWSIFDGSLRFEVVNAITLAVGCVYCFGQDKEYASRMAEKAKKKERLELAASWQKIAEIPRGQIWDAQFILFPWIVAAFVLLNYITPLLGIAVFCVLYKWRSDNTLSFFAFCDWHTKERKRLELCKKEDKEWTDFSVWMFENKIQRPSPAGFAAVCEKYVASKKIMCAHCNAKAEPEIKSETPQ